MQSSCLQVTAATAPKSIDRSQAPDPDRANFGVRPLVDVFAAIELLRRPARQNICLANRTGQGREGGAPL